MNAVSHCRQSPIQNVTTILNTHNYAQLENYPSSSTYSFTCEKYLFTYLPQEKYANKCQFAQFCLLLDEPDRVSILVLGV
jgi:hypothetical protein